MQNLQKINKLYYEVFDTNDKITACGRDKCKSLILACQKLNPQIDFGNADTGMMNVDNIVNFKKNLEVCL